ncbi:hypothetical protein C8J56DRAFT_783492 [Mycena floridula]|nr:hypothetical protein C8J56DRAFT_783492 [Mycena floridula]
MPKELKRLYMARVNSHLIAGCDVSPDATAELLSKLEDVQVSYIRYVTGLPVVAPLYMETGLTPLRIQWLTLSLGFTQYLTDLKRGHYARAAFRDSCAVSP